MVYDSMGSTEIRELEYLYHEYFDRQSPTNKRAFELRVRIEELEARCQYEVRLLRSREIPSLELADEYDPTQG